MHKLLASVGALPEEGRDQRTSHWDRKKKRERELGLLQLFGNVGTGIYCIAQGGLNLDLCPPYPRRDRLG